MIGISPSSDEFAEAACGDEKGVVGVAWWRLAHPLNLCRDGCGHVGIKPRRVPLQNRVRGP